MLIMKYQKLLVLNLMMVFNFVGYAQNNALDFDGVNNYINCGSSINSSVGNQITISAWVYPEFNAYGDRGIVTNYWYTTAPEGGAGIFAWTTTGDNHKWSCFISTQAGGIKTIYSTAEIVTGVWTHVAMTYDNSVLRLYINGEEIASTICGAGCLEDPTNNNPFYIAKHSYGTNCFNGKIDEVRIWNDARNEIEIRKNMYRELADPGSEANLVAYYKFNETTGMTLADSKGTNTGTLTNMAGDEWISSLPLTSASNALDFDGINDYVVLDDYSLYTGLSSLTVEAWVYPTASTGWHEVFQVLPNNITLALSGTSLYGFINDNAAGVQNSISIANAVTLNDWCHIAMTWDSSTGEHILYSNGVEIGSISNASTDALVAGTGGPFIGTLEGSSEMFQGAIDELRIWNTARSATEINNKMCEELNGDETGLIGYYSFNQTIGTTLLDITSNNNHGTLTNMDDSDWITSGAFIYAPDITTQAVSSINTTTATGNGNITNLGNPAPTAHGVCWNTTGTPTIGDSKTDDGAASATGTFISNITGLAEGTLYYVRSYATNPNGTVYGDEVSFTTLMTPPGNALDFDGTLDVVKCGNDASIQIGGTAISIEAWIKPIFFNAGFYEHTIVAKSHNTSSPDTPYGYDLRCGGDGILDFNLAGTTNVWTHLSTPTGSLILNEWQHVAATYDGASQKIYINGVLIVSQATSITIEADTEKELSIGAHAFYPDREFIGSIDEVKIWNDTRTETEIRDNLAYSLVGNESNLSAYYNFDNSSGTTLNDNSSNSNTGTLTNMTDADWISSGAMIYSPNALDASNISGTSFTANWEQNYTATKYYLDVSTVSDFSSFITGYQNLEIENGTTSSKVVSGLNPSSEYYYRVRVYNGNILDTSSYSNVQSITTLSTYYMAKTDGDWSTTSIWFTNTTGGTDPGTYTTAATETPTALNSDGIIINADVAVDTDISIDQTTVNTGKTLTVDNGVTLSVSNGDGDDLTITGAIANNGTVAPAALSVVVYNGGDQDVLALTYATLSFTGSTTASIKTFADGITIVENEIYIADAITLTGSAADAVTVQVTTPGTGGTDSRVFNIDASGKTVNISHITIKGGDVSGLGTGWGGSIYNHSGGSLNLANVSISESKAQWGGGIYAEYDAITTLENCTVSSCYATYNGGGISIWDATCSINNCQISDNTAEQRGGGISNEGESAGANITITNTTIEGNAATNSGSMAGGIFNDGYGGDAIMTITNSTIFGNTSRSSLGGIGIHQSMSGGTVSVTIENSTISGNSVTDGSEGGGIGMFAGTLNIKNTIVANNSVASGNNDYFSISSYTIHPSLNDNGYNIVGYQGFRFNASTIPWVEDEAFDSQNSILYNCDYAGNIKTAWNKNGTDLDNQNLNLSSTLADNGGPTETLALTSASFAAGAIPYADAGDGIWNGSSTTGGSYFDQRDVETTSPNPICVGSFSEVLNAPPVANDTTFYHYYNSSDESFAVAADGVLDNDVDTDCDALTAVLDTDVSTGTLTLDSDGSFTYDFTGLSPDITETFTYYANDGTVNSTSTATVTLKVLAAKFEGPGTDFNDPGNWNCGYVPDEILDIVIGAGEHMDVNADFTCKSIKFEAGSSFKCIDGKALTITGNVLNRLGNVSIEIFTSLVVYTSIEINNQ